MARLSSQTLVYTSAFGARDPIKTAAGVTESFHYGIDFGPEQRGKQGVPLCAVFAGRATHLADQYGALGVRVTATAGDVGLDLLRRLYPARRVTASTPVAVSLWHLASRAVAHAAQVVAGAVLGVMGSTGRSTGVHVHVELTIGGVRVDPKPFIDAQASKAVAPAPADYYEDEEDDPMRRYMFNDATRQITWPNGVTNQYDQQTYDALQGYIGTYDWAGRKHSPQWAWARDTFVRESWVAVNHAKG